MATLLQIALTARDLNYSDLAQRVDRSPAWIAQVAKGHRQPSDALAARIGEVLGVDSADLFGNDTDHVIISFVRRTAKARGVPEVVIDPAAAERIAEALR